MTRTTDELALLAAIRAQPDDDTLRLAYADYLDGLDTVSVSCLHCGGAGRAEKFTGAVDWWQGKRGPSRVTTDCLKCLGSGFVLDAASQSVRARAELIRVQCEIARTPRTSETCPHCGCDDGYNHNTGCLCGREDELLAANVDRWRRAGPCPECEGSGHGEYGSGVCKDGYVRNHWKSCPACHGTGDAGGLLWPAWDNSRMSHEPPQITYHRGMKRVHCRAGEVWVQEMFDYPGPAGQLFQRPVWLPTPWALAVCRHHPDVVEFWVETTAGNSWTWGEMPPELFAAVKGHVTADEGKHRLANVAVRWVHGFLNAPKPENLLD